MIGWMASYGMIPSVVLGFNGKALKLVRILYRCCCVKPGAGNLATLTHGVGREIDADSGGRQQLIEKAVITSEII